MNQRDPRLARLEQRTQNTSTVMVLVLVVLLVQLWLLSIALEDFMAAENGLAIPTFAASCFCLLINVWLLKYVYDVDRDAEKP